MMVTKTQAHYEKIISLPPRVAFAALSCLGPFQTPYFCPLEFNENEQRQAKTIVGAYLH